MAETTGDDVVVVEETTLENISGQDYQSKVTGRTRVGAKANPPSSLPTDFTAGTMQAISKQNAQGGWEIETMYPELKP